MPGFGLFEYGPRVRFIRVLASVYLKFAYLCLSHCNHRHAFSHGWDTFFPYISEEDFSGIEMDGLTPFPYISKAEEDFPRIEMDGITLFSQYMVLAL